MASFRKASKRCKSSTSTYLGPGDVFDQAIADFAATYADQNERDYEPWSRP